MIFNSLTFLVFLLVVWSLHQLPISWRAKKLNLLLASYLFYASWNPPFVLLLWISTLIDWFAARGIARGARWRRAFLALSLATNLGLLGFFKYGGFLLENMIGLAALVGIEYRPAAPSIVLPIGISFYTFQTLSYTLDVYRGRMAPWHSFLDYALYVSFFPQLVAGPIVRARQWLPQCLEPRRASPTQLGWGLSLLVVGLVEKVVLADGLFAPVADQVFGAPLDAGFMAAWLGTLAFSAQIFCDFSGYSLCAVGVASCLGFVVPDNFRFPYAAIGFSDFWRRWHVSLSTWLRDYVYVPLGGNRKGALRTSIHVLVTMLIGGFWHGAGWHFVAWGGIHGILLAIERPLRPMIRRAVVSPSPWGRLGIGAATFTGVCLAWVFFRAANIGDAMHLLSTMLTPTRAGSGLTAVDTAIVLVTISCMLAGQWWLRDSSLEQMTARTPWWLRALVLGALLLALLLSPGENRAFIYFQF